jgi:hypothetical protein
MSNWIALPLMVISMGLPVGLVLRSLSTPADVLVVIIYVAALLWLFRLIGRYQQ